MTLSAERVGYRYAGARRPSLLDLDLEVADGEVIGVAGASESGKTTLCLVLSGLAPRTIGGQVRGALRLDGEIVDGWPMHRLSEHIGIGFQSPTNQLSQVAQTVFEEVAFGPMNLGMPRDDVIDRAWAALDRLRIADLAARDPLRLSGGQQQLVAMAGLVAMRPRHLVLDEPTAQLDPEGTRLVAEAIAELAAMGTSIVIAEQKTDLLAAVCSRALVLVAGKVEILGSVGDVFRDERLADLGVAEPASVRLPRLAIARGVASAAMGTLRAAVDAEIGLG
jgi:energy-coupling factor transporter ATP-binding protein EcfA2